MRGDLLLRVHGVARCRGVGGPHRRHGDGQQLAARVQLRRELGDERDPVGSDRVPRRSTVAEGEDLEGDAYREPRVVDLLQRTHATPFSEGAFSSGNHVGAEVKVTLADGRAFTSKIAKPLGRTSANPVSEAGMLAKFESCAARALPAAWVKKLVQAIDQIEQCKSIRDFTAHIETVAPMHAGLSN